MKKLILVTALLSLLAGCGILPPPDPVPRESAYHWHKEQRVQDKILKEPAERQEKEIKIPIEKPVE